MVVQTAVETTGIPEVQEMEPVAMSVEADAMVVACLEVDGEVEATAVVWSEAEARGLVCAVADWSEAEVRALVCSVVD